MRVRSQPWAKPFFPNTKSKLRTLALKLINDTYSAINLIKGDFDIFHPTYYDTYFLKFLGKKPFVLSVYDMNHEIYPDTASKLDFTVEWKRKLLSKATRIITISKQTKKDIIKFYGTDESKIDVVYLATHFEQVKDQKPPIDNFPDKYIMFFGQRGKYKNFMRFAEALPTLLSKDG